MDWMKIEAPSLEDIEALARFCFAELPSAFRELAGDITFMVQDFSRRFRGRGHGVGIPL
jgi:predicted Zn-dependent protease with MMP-like domain